MREGSRSRASSSRWVVSSVLATSIVSLVAVATTVAALAHAPRPRGGAMRVCRHKNCARQYRDGDLTETIRNLLPPEVIDDDLVAVESGGCLSGCGKGPNVATTTTNDDGDYDDEVRVFHGIDGPVAVAEMLRSRYSLECPPMLMAACDVMAKADKLASPAKKDRFLTSAIDALSADPTLATSRALATALLSRADVRGEMGNLDDAVRDCREAARIDPRSGAARRRLADALEAAGDTLGALEVVTECLSGELEGSLELDRDLVAKTRRDAERLRAELSSN